MIGKQIESKVASQTTENLAAPVGQPAFAYLSLRSIHR